MEKIKIYIYPNSLNHVHDNESLHLVNGKSQYINTVPLSKIGIQKHCEIVSAENADYFYMGQISDGVSIPNQNDFEYFVGNENKHICDIEGDWLNRELPNWLKKCILTINGARKDYKDCKMFVRPTFSYLLLELAKNQKKFPIRKINKITFGFKGLSDPRLVRHKMVEAFKKSNLEGNVELNSVWMAQNDINSLNTTIYINLMKENIISLCPMGAGFDSIRFYESCYYGSVPVIISDVFTPFYENFKKPFFFEIDYRLSEKEIMDELIKISQTDLTTITQMSINAQEYFQTKIVEYFEDPTLTFIKWLKNYE